MVEFMACSVEGGRRKGGGRGGGKGGAPLVLAVASLVPVSGGDFARQCRGAPRVSSQLFTPHRWDSCDFHMVSPLSLISVKSALREGGGVG